MSFLGCMGVHRSEPRGHAWQEDFRASVSKTKVKALRPWHLTPAYVLEGTEGRVGTGAASREPVTSAPQQPRCQRAARNWAQTLRPCIPCRQTSVFLGVLRLRLVSVKLCAAPGRPPG